MQTTEIDSEQRTLLEQQVLTIARDRGITAPDGPSPLQHFEVFEDFHLARAKTAAEAVSTDPLSSHQCFLAKALGQCLFDLIIQTRFQGVSLEMCVDQGNPHAVRPPVWPLVDSYVEGLRVAIATLPPGEDETMGAIAQVYSCLATAAQTHLGMAIERCLELSLEVV